MKTRLINLAKAQKTSAAIAALVSTSLRSGNVEPRRRGGVMREAKRWINDVLEVERRMQGIIIGQVRDYQDNTDFLLMEAVNRLTISRITRAQYAGRVLP